MARIIMVEDDPMISDIYNKKFSAAGLDITIVSSGKEFLSKVKENKFDVALLDMVLPEMNGIEILQELKKGEYNPEMKVFIFSNLSSKEDYDNAMGNGADGFIPKTQFSPSELVIEITRRVNEIAERKKNEMRRNKNQENDEKNENDNSGKKKILFIEDEKIFLEIFVRKLRDEGYGVETAKNGAWGCREALNGNFDLIITDMVMPAMDGLEIVKKLKSEEKTKNIPIIAISASSTDEKVKEIRELGVSDFFVKTRIVPSDLARRANEILNV